MARWIYGFCEVKTRNLTFEEMLLLRQEEVRLRWVTGTRAFLAVVGGVVLLMSIGFLSSLPPLWWPMFAIVVAAFIYLLWSLGKADTGRIYRKDARRAGFVTLFERRGMPPDVENAYLLAYGELDDLEDPEDPDAFEKTEAREWLHWAEEKFEADLRKESGGEVDWLETVGDGSVIYSIAGVRASKVMDYPQIHVDM